MSLRFTGRSRENFMRDSQEYFAFGEDNEKVIVSVSREAIRNGSNYKDTASKKYHDGITSKEKYEDEGEFTTVIITTEDF